MIQVCWNNGKEALENHQGYPTLPEAEQLRGLGQGIYLHAAQGFI